MSLLLIGLTGSIGMGKSQTAMLFQEAGVLVYDADATVHQLYAPGGKAVAPVAALFPESLREGAIDRAILSTYVINNPEALKQLETIVHPLAREAQRDFIREAVATGQRRIVLDIPLLFEKQGEKFVDVVIVVSAPAELQKQRVLARPNMSEEKFNDILAKQVPDAEKRARADYIVDSSISVEHARAQVQEILADLEGRAGKVFDALYSDLG